MIHRLDVRTKMLWFLGIVILSFLFQDPLYLLFAATLTALLAFWIKIPLKKILGMLTPLLPIFISIILISGFTYSPGRFHHFHSQIVLFYALPGNHLGVTLGGLMLGITFFLRLICMLLASSVLTLTTSIDDFIQFFHKIKVPGEISMMLTMAIRFIPTMDKKRMQVLEAQKARGAKLNGKGIAGPILAYIPIMIPLFINAILMANSLSMAMLNRGYGLNRTWTHMQDIVLAARDYCAISLIFILTTLAVLLRFKFQLGLL